MVGLLPFGAAAVSLAASLTAVRAADSDFDLDPRLHRSFWGVAYTPANSAYYPNCGDTIDEVMGDVRLLSQLTTRIRLYGTDCDQFSLVQEAIKRTKTNLHVYAGIFIDGNETTYQRQRDTAFQVLDSYGVDNILGITVGNEYLLQQSTAGNSLATAQTLLISKMADVRTMLASKSYGKTIPVGTADAGSQITAALSEAADYIMANTHAFFSGVTISGAADWTAQYLVNDQPHFATDAGKPLISAEVGWPSNSMAGGDLTLNGSAATIPNLQTFLDTFVCAANDNITANNPYGKGYFYFELFDADWKKQYGGAEPYWGLFDDKRVLKDITIPTCEAPAEAAVNGNTGNNNNGGSGSGSNSNNSNNNGGKNGATHMDFTKPMALASALVLAGGLFLW